MRWLPILLACCAFCQSRESIDKQLESVARQREAIRRASAAPDSPAEDAAPACATMPDETVTPLIESAAKVQQLPAKLLRAVAAQESGFRSCAVSKKGAKGLMQLMP